MRNTQDFPPDPDSPPPDPNFGKAVLKVKHSFARVQNSGARRTLSRRTLGACPCRAKMKKAPRKTEVLFLEWEQRESNPRPSACKADALNQLSYAPKRFFNLWLLNQDLNLGPSD